jgi:hypothetical protein
MEVMGGLEQEHDELTSLHKIILTTGLLFISRSMKTTHISKVLKD